MFSRAKGFGSGPMEREANSANRGRRRGRSPPWVVLLASDTRNHRAGGDPLLREYTPLFSPFSLILEKKDQRDHRDLSRPTGPETQELSRTGLHGPSPTLPRNDNRPQGGLFPSSGINHPTFRKDRRGPVLLAQHALMIKTPLTARPRRVIMGARVGPRADNHKHRSTK